MADFGYRAFNALRPGAKSKRNSLQCIKTGRGDNTLGHNVTLVLLLFLVLTGKQTAYANVPNTYWANSGENDFTIELNNTSFPSNLAGASVEIHYGTQGVSQEL